ELSLQQAHVVRLESRPPNVEGKGAVTIRDLVRNALRMRPDRIVVGEVRGGETLDMLQAMNTGHEGSLATVHANSAIDALGRLETLATMSELELPISTLRDQINGAIDVIVHLERGIDGSRRVSEVQAVVSEHREDYALSPIVKFEPEPLGPDRLVRGQFRFHGVPAHIQDRLHIAGEVLPAGPGEGR
ncbi:MAG: ATPase, T2SS/T4P/T4SS family, partial [Cellulomonadaceae bacterium]